MVIVMDMNTGKTEKQAFDEPAEEEFGAFVDEVMNAGWLPQPDARLELHAHETPADKKAPPEVDAEAFLQSLYRSQE